jgi:hypothetical protein
MKNISKFAEAIAVMAKTNKVSKAKVEAFVGEILAKAAGMGGEPGRPVSAKMQKVRDAVLAYAEKNGTFTAKQIADQFEMDVADVNLAIRWHNRDADVFVNVGTEAKTDKTPGRRQIVWAKK